MSRHDRVTSSKPNSLIPAINILDVNNASEILLQRRRDSGQWAPPGEAQDIGESPAQCAVRECEDETGIIAEITDLLGIYSKFEHIIAYTADGEIRQQYEFAYIGRPVGGTPSIIDEADGVRRVQTSDLNALDIRPSTHELIGHYLAGTTPTWGDR